MEPIGLVLSGATLHTAKFQPFINYENKIRVGLLVKILPPNSLCSQLNGAILARITDIKFIHEYMEEGDILSEARRKKALSPGFQSLLEEFARVYAVAELEFLNLIVKTNNKYKLVLVSKPPKPGSVVCPLSIYDSLRICGINVDRLRDPLEIMDTSLNFKIGFGSLYGYEELETGRAAPSVIDLNNITMHIAVIGTTGSGKSYTTGFLIEQLSRAYKVGNEYFGVPLIIFDANGDYLDYISIEGRDALVGHKNIYRVCVGLHYTSSFIEHDDANTFRPKLDLDSLSSTELAEAIIQFYHGGVSENVELQISLLSQMIQILKSSRISMNLAFKRNLLHEILNIAGENRAREVAEVIRSCTGVRNERLAYSLVKLISTKHKATIGAVLRALEKFYDIIVRQYDLVPRTSGDATINKEFLNNLTNPKSPGIAIFDFSAEGSPGVELIVKQFLVYYTLNMAYKYFTEKKITNEQRLLGIVIEEAQNYAPNTREYPVTFSIARNTLATIATQGRKFGISLIIVTQRPLYVDPVVMAMINTYIIHRISPADVKYVNIVSGGLPKYMLNKLVSLDTGVAVLTGQLNPLPFPLIISLLGKRRAPHKAGFFSIKEYFKQQEMNI